MKALWLGCALLLCASRLLAAPPVVEPVIESGKPAVLAQDGKSYPVFRAATDAKLVRAIDHVFATSFAGEMEKLYLLAREVAKSRHHDRPEFAAPLYLLLSQEEGGFARRDFFLQAADGQRTFIAADYVDLQVDEDSVASGDFEEIFSHELGHILLRTLLGDLVGPRSNKMHQSMTLTDYRTAFDEGFAEHFQPVAREYTTNPNLQRLFHGGGPQPLSEDFFNHRDQSLRNAAPKTDTFVHERLVPPCISIRECYVLEETSTAFDYLQLRTGQQMLSSEGVVATVFYHLVSQTGEHGCTHAGTAPECPALTAAYERIFQALADVTPNPTQSPLIAFLDSYRQRFAAEGKVATEDFVLLTRGATASLDAFRTAQAAETASAHADIPGFRKHMHALRDLLHQLVDDVSSGKRKLDAAVGPELWVRNEAFTHSSLWSESEETPLRINLNTASAEELATLPQFTPEFARAIVLARKQRGSFASIDQIISEMGLSAAQAEVLKNAAHSQATAKPDPVQ